MANNKENSLNNQKYMNPTQLHSLAICRYEEISRYCNELESRIAKYPAGKIHVVKSKRGVQYYLREDSGDKSGKYISKKDEKTIKCFLQKKYDEKVYKELFKEQLFLEKFITRPTNSNIQSIYSDDIEEVKRNISPVDLSDEDFIKEWLSETYIGKEISDSIPIFMTDKGERVRSKSELNIANILSKYNIPYKYECPFVMSSGKIIYPDFTVLNVKKRKVILWEHRGMMDDLEYTQYAIARIKSLANDGVLLGDNLIITEETKKSPLGTNEIENMIKRFLLSR